MHARRIVLAAATALVVASPAFAAGSYGEGTLWTNLMALRTELAAQHGAPAAVETAPAAFGNIYEELSAAQRSRADEEPRGVAGPAGPAHMPGERGWSYLDNAGEVSIYEQFIGQSRGS